MSPIRLPQRFLYRPATYRTTGFNIVSAITRAQKRTDNSCWWLWGMAEKSSPLKPHEACARCPLQRVFPITNPIKATNDVVFVLFHVWIIRPHIRKTSWQLPSPLPKCQPWNHGFDRFLRRRCNQPHHNDNLACHIKRGEIENVSTVILQHGIALGLFIQTR
jgi:hypothetical protein